MSFFSLLKHVFENVLGGKGELNKVCVCVNLSSCLAVCQRCLSCHLLYFLCLAKKQIEQVCYGVCK